MKEKQIKSIVDVGCGDWQIMSNIDLTGIQYTGYDASALIISKNSKFATDNVTFVHTPYDE